MSAAIPDLALVLDLVHLATAPSPPPAEAPACDLIAAVPVAAMGPSGLVPAPLAELVLEYLVAHPEPVKATGRKAEVRA